MSIKSLFGKFIRSKVTWQKLEYFDDKWKVRIETMASLIPANTKSVVDLGCGKMWLKDYLNHDIKYVGVDYVLRGENCVVNDFNKYEFPERKVDVIFVSGCMEYVFDYEWFIQSISAHAQCCIISYCILEDNPDIEKRRKRAWVNDLNEKEIIECFEKRDMYLEKKIVSATQNHIYKFFKR